MPYVFDIVLRNPFVPMSIQEVDEARKAESFTIGQFGHVDPEKVPMELYKEKAKYILDNDLSQLPAIFSLSGYFFVNKMVMEKLEELEPGIHQFIPVEVFGRESEIADPPYYRLRIGNRVDAIDPEKTTVRKDSNNKYLVDLARDGEVIVFRKEIVGGMALWSDKHLLSGYGCSDQFYQFVEKNKIMKFGLLLYAYVD